jgi:hypothetical protein
MTDWGGGCKDKSGVTDTGYHILLSVCLIGSYTSFLDQPASHVSISYSGNENGNLLPYILNSTPAGLPMRLGQQIELIMPRGYSQVSMATIYLVCSQ